MVPVANHVRTTFPVPSLSKDKELVCDYDADFIFQQDLAPAHSAKATSTRFKDHGIPVLNWPANLPDLHPIENLCGIVKR